LIQFEVISRDPGGHARCGTVRTPHGTIRTPAFMPVGTKASVKGVWPQQVAESGADILLGNTYHLCLRPGAELVAEMGGLHRFMGWDGSILTDSGGYQVFSLAELNKITDEGVSFRSHIDGRWLHLNPAEAMRIQNLLGADIIMAFDQCPPGDADRVTVARAVERTIRWADECRRAHARNDQALFGIVQGGVFHDLRAACAERLIELDLPGYAIGGLSVGETHAQMVEVLRELVHRLPADKPRYLMGVGMPRDILTAETATPSPRPDRCGCGTKSTGRRTSRLRRIARARPAGVSAGHTSGTSSWRARCSARCCCRCITYGFFSGLCRVCGT
jgi:queuine tRNA-ribosyltransferase